jgi:hypothetical protein
MTSFSLPVVVLGILEIKIKDQILGDVMICECDTRSLQPHRHRSLTTK